MGEPAASIRPLNGAEEFDRRMRTIARTPPHAEALAELARLVDSQGAFGVFQAAHGAAEPVPGAEATGNELEAFDAEFRGAAAPGDEPGGPVEPAVVQVPVPGLQDWERVVPRYPSVSIDESRPIEATPDVWAQSGDDGEDAIGAPPLTATRDTPPGEGTSPKRTLIVLAAVVLLTAGGLGASFLARPSVTAIAAATATPTILAASGPSKVQPETPATGDDAPSEPSKLLDKNKNDGTAEAKIISTVEQPVDLAQAVKPAAPEVTEAAAAPAPASAFPQPRKVKTILVRPDGSIIPDAAPAPSEAPPAAPSAGDQQASLAFDPKAATLVAQPDATPAAPAAVPAADAAPPPAETPRTPAGKTTTRATTAKPAASTTQEGSAAAQARSTVATPKAKPVAHAKPKPKPVAAAPVDAPAPAAVADAAPAAATPDATPTASVAQGGAFAIQLGAAPTEAEGQATAARLGQKYAADLGGAAPAIRKAQAGGKTVFRIRIGNLSRDEAKAMCAKVQAGGDGCFVARK